MRPFSPVPKGGKTSFSLATRAYRCLSSTRQHQIWLLLLVTFLSAFAEAISLGAVLPFVAALATPEKLFRFAFVAHLATRFGWSAPAQLVFPITLIFLTLIAASAALRMFALWWNNRLAYAICADLGESVYRRILCEPLSVQNSRNTSDVISTIANNTNLTALALQNCLVLIGSLGMIAAITFAFLAINAMVTIAVALLFGGIYAAVVWGIRLRLKTYSNLQQREYAQMIRTLQEGLGSIRDVLLDGTQREYCELFDRWNRPMKLAQGNTIFLTGSPRFLMEALGMLLVTAVAYRLSQQEGGIASSLPLLGAFALGAQRLLPALQQAYSAWAVVASSHAQMENTLEVLERPVPEEYFLPPPVPLPFRNVLALENVRFRYRPDGPWVLDGVSLEIPRGSRVGIVGSTGSGKSTLLDILMMLLQPTEGRLLVDGEPLDSGNRRAWQQNIAHVPQSIFLTDTSFAENIAFGSLSLANVDLDRVHEAARQAQIASFIEAKPGGYKSVVGERGVLLSGGQRQRIGVARALYKRANVLVFDEATSALDGQTEKEVMEAIDGLSRDLTLLMVAHRLSTVRGCDRIIELRGGRVVAQGTYEALLEQSATFREMARLSEK